MSEEFEIANQNGIIRGCVTESEDMRAVLLCLHGTPNGDLHGNDNVFDQLAEAAKRSGFTTVQYSFFGSAPSDGTAAQTSIRTQSVDYLAVLNYVRKNFTCPIHIVGESAGATVAAMNWQEDVESYILLWPAFDLKDTDLRPYLTPKWLSVVEKDGYMQTDGIVIGRELFEELLFTDFDPCFKIPDVKTLIMHGRSDRDVPYGQSLRAVSQSTGNVTFISSRNAAHGFKDFRPFVLKAVMDWLRER